MLYCGVQFSRGPDCRVGCGIVLRCAAAFLIFGLASSHAAAGVLDKLLAPAVGAKPGFSEGKKTYDEDTMKPEELAACVVKAHDIDARAANWKKDAPGMAREREQLSQTAIALQTAIEESKKNPLPDEEAKKINDQLAAYKIRQAEFNKRAEETNVKAAEFNRLQNADLDAFRNDCAGKRFYRSDLNAIRPNLPFDISDILEGKK